jgi:hypothetical protein
MKDFDVAELRNEWLYAILVIILAYRKKHLVYQNGFPRFTTERKMEKF